MQALLQLQRLFNIDISARFDPECPEHFSYRRRVRIGRDAFPNA
tara:strand:- start:540 stop:671 length:132 start_codon:yes stop_codon:yes gene_type:complete